MLRSTLFAAILTAGIFVFSAGQATRAVAQVAPTSAAASTSPSTSPQGAAGAETSAPPGQVNLNTASAAELQRLPGVGPARAQAIVERRARRPFRRIQELMRIRGIGRKTFRRLRPMLTLDGPTTLR